MERLRSFAEQAKVQQNAYVSSKHIDVNIQLPQQEEKRQPIDIEVEEKPKANPWQSSYYLDQDGKEIKKSKPTISQDDIFNQALDDSSRNRLHKNNLFKSYAELAGIDPNDGIQQANFIQHLMHKQMGLTDEQLSNPHVQAMLWQNQLDMLATVDEDGNIIQRQFPVTQEGRAKLIREAATLSQNLNRTRNEGFQFGLTFFGEDEQEYRKHFDRNKSTQGYVMHDQAFSDGMKQGGAIRQAILSEPLLAKAYSADNSIDSATAIMEYIWIDEETGGRVPFNVAKKRANAVMQLLMNTAMIEQQVLTTESVNRPTRALASLGSGILGFLDSASAQMASAMTQLFGDNDQDTKEFMKLWHTLHNQAKAMNWSQHQTYDSFLDQSLNAMGSVLPYAYGAGLMLKGVGAFGASAHTTKAVASGVAFKKSVTTPQLIAKGVEGVANFSAGYALSANPIIQGSIQQIRMNNPDADEGLVTGLGVLAGAIQIGIEKLQVSAITRYTPNLNRFLQKTPLIGGMYKKEGLASIVSGASKKGLAREAFKAWTVSAIEENLQEMTVPFVEQIASALSKDIEGYTAEELFQTWVALAPVASMAGLPYAIAGAHANRVNNALSLRAFNEFVQTDMTRESMLNLGMKADTVDAIYKTDDIFEKARLFAEGIKTENREVAELKSNELANLVKISSILGHTDSNVNQLIGKVIDSDIKLGNVIYSMSDVADEVNRQLQRDSDNIVFDNYDSALNSPYISDDTKLHIQESIDNGTFPVALYGDRQVIIFSEALDFQYRDSGLSLQDAVAQVLHHELIHEGLDISESNTKLKEKFDNFDLAQEEMLADMGEQVRLDIKGNILRDNNGDVILDAKDSGKTLFGELWSRAKNWFAKRNQKISDQELANRLGKLIEQGKKYEGGKKAKSEEQGSFRHKDLTGRQAEYYQVQQDLKALKKKGDKANFTDSLPAQRLRRLGIDPQVAVRDAGADKGLVDYTRTYYGDNIEGLKTIAIAKIRMQNEAIQTRANSVMTKAHFDAEQSLAVMANADANTDLSNITKILDGDVSLLKEIIRITRLKQESRTDSVREKALKVLELIREEVIPALSEKTRAKLEKVNLEDKQQRQLRGINKPPEVSDNLVNVIAKWAPKELGILNASEALKQKASNNTAKATKFLRERVKRFDKEVRESNKDHEVIAQIVNETKSLFNHNPEALKEFAKHLAWATPFDYAGMMAEARVKDGSTDIADLSRMVLEIRNDATRKLVAGMHNYAKSLKLNEEGKFYSSKPILTLLSMRSKDVRTFTQMSALDKARSLVKRFGRLKIDEPKSFTASQMQDAYFHYVHKALDMSSEKRNARINELEDIGVNLFNQVTVEEFKGHTEFRDQYLQAQEYRALRNFNVFDGHLDAVEALARLESDLAGRRDALKQEKEQAKKFNEARDLLAKGIDENKAVKSDVARGFRDFFVRATASLKHLLSPLGVSDKKVNDYLMSINDQVNIATHMANINFTNISEQFANLAFDSGLAYRSRYDSDAVNTGMFMNFIRNISKKDKALTKLLAPMLHTGKAKTVDAYADKDGKRVKIGTVVVADGESQHQVRSINQDQAMNLYASLKQSEMDRYIHPEGKGSKTKLYDSKDAKAKELKPLYEGVFEVLDNYLSDQHKDFISKVSELATEYFQNLVVPTARNVLGIDVLLAGKDYAPLRFAKEQAGEISEVVSSLSTLPSIAKARTKHSEPLDLEYSFMNSFNRAFREMSNFNAFAEIQKEVTSVFGSKQVKIALRNVYGDKMRDTILNRFADVFSGGYRDIVGKLGVEGFINYWKASKIAFNLGVVTRQFSSIVAPALEYSVLDTGKYIASAFTPDGFNAMVEMFRSMPMEYRRNMGFSEEVADVIASQRTTSASMLYKGLIDSGMYLNKIADAMALLPVAQAIYRSEIVRLRQENPNMDIAKIKELASIRALSDAEGYQQSSQVKDMSHFSNRGGTWYRATMAFTNTTRQYASYEVEAFRSFYGAPTLENAMKLGRVLGVNHLALPSMFVGLDMIYRQMLVALGADEELSEFKKERLISAILLGPSSGIFFFGAVIVGTLEGIINGNTRGSITSINGMIQDLMTVSNSVSRSIQDEREWKETMKRIASVMSPAFRDYILVTED